MNEGHIFADLNKGRNNFVNDGHLSVKVTFLQSQRCSAYTCFALRSQCNEQLTYLYKTHNNSHIDKKHTRIGYNADIIMASAQTTITSI